MKKQISPEQRSYRDNRDRHILGMIAPCGLLGLAIWMLIDPSVKKHARVEKATVALVKDIWGTPAGIVLLVLGLAWFIYAFVQYRKFKKNVVKPG